MQQIIQWLQLIVSVLLVVAIILQQRGAGSSAIMGGGGASYYTKRGFEKTLFYATIGLAVLFIGLAIVNFLV